MFADAMRLLDHWQDPGLGRVDVVVSGVPFSAIPEPVASQIMQAIYQSLFPGETFLAYQFQDDVERYARPLFGPCRKQGRATENAA